MMNITEYFPMKKRCTPPHNSLRSNVQRRNKLGSLRKTPRRLATLNSTFSDIEIEWDCKSPSPTQGSRRKRQKNNDGKIAKDNMSALVCKLDEQTDGFTSPPSLIDVWNKSDNTTPLAVSKKRAFSGFPQRRSLRKSSRLTELKKLAKELETTQPCLKESSTVEVKTDNDEAGLGAEDLHLVEQFCDDDLFDHWDAEDDDFLFDIPEGNEESCELDCVNNLEAETKSIPPSKTNYELAAQKNSEQLRDKGMSNSITAQPKQVDFPHRIAKQAEQDKGLNRTASCIAQSVNQHPRTKNKEESENKRAFTESNRMSHPSREGIKEDNQTKWTDRRGNCSSRKFPQTFDNTLKTLSASKNNLTPGHPVVNKTSVYNDKSMQDNRVNKIVSPKMSNGVMHNSVPGASSALHRNPLREKKAGPSTESSQNFCSTLKKESCESPDKTQVLSHTQILESSSKCEQGSLHSTKNMSETVTELWDLYDGDDDDDCDLILSAMNIEAFTETDTRSNPPVKRVLDSGVNINIAEQNSNRNLEQSKSNCILVKQNSSCTRLAETSNSGFCTSVRENSNPKSGGNCELVTSTGITGNHKSSAALKQEHTTELCKTSTKLANQSLVSRITGPVSATVSSKVDRSTDVSTQNKAQAKKSFICTQEQIEEKRRKALERRKQKMARIKNKVPQVKDGNNNMSTQNMRKYTFTNRR